MEEATPIEISSNRSEPAPRPDSTSPQLGRITPPSYQCGFCNFKEANLLHLKRHQKLEHECVKCDYAGSHSELMYHKMHRHKGYAHDCDHCEYASSKVDDLHMHVKVRHALVEAEDTISQVGRVYFKGMRIRIQEFLTSWIRIQHFFRRMQESAATLAI